VPASGLAPEPEPTDLDALAALAEPHRCQLYSYVAERHGWVSREQAADAVGLRRGVAAHHLDRLVNDGLLEADYQQRSGRRGPGSGRPAKVYRRSPSQFGVSLPARQYELAGRVLAAAADEARRDLPGVEVAIRRSARAAGRDLGDQIRGQLSPRAAATTRRSEILRALEGRGYEPEMLDDGCTVLHNCPFHRLAQEHTELVCGLNLELLDSLIATVGDTGLKARLEPHDDTCCVRLDRARRPGA
jgi:predicted ArsR family transcriptional regulator